MRLVSLVPSTTETLFALGVGDSIVGRSAFCVRPAEAAAIPQVGGTKNPNLPAIAALQPSLILVNAEENRAEDVAGLMRLAPVLSFYPRTVADAIADIELLGAAVGRDAPARVMAAEARARLAEVRAAACPFRYAYLIWQDPWLAAGPGAYIADVLAQAGGVNVFADAATRYPTVTPGVLFARAPDTVFLPDEPFPFAARHADALAALAPDPARWRPRLRLVDGQLWSWHGARLLDGLAALRAVAPLL